MRIWRLVLLAPLLLMAADCIGRLAAIDTRLSEVEHEISELEAKDSRTDEEQARLVSLYDQRVKLLSKRKDEEEKRRAAGSGIEGLLIGLGAILGIPFLGMAGRGISAALQPKPKA